MMRLYKRLMRGVRGVNTANRIHIILENALTPAKLMPMLRDIARTTSEGTAYSREWAEKLSRMLEASGKSTPEPFRRHCIRPHLVLYKGPAPQGTRNKTLVFCVTGAARRMMMPLAALLQHFDATEVDVAMLRYPRRTGYRHGVEGLGTTFEEVLQNLPRAVGADAYARVVAFGTSGGAVPAALLALMHGFDRCLAVGTGSMSDERWPEGLRQMVERMLARTGSRRTLFTFMFGTDDEADAQAADEWARLLPNTLKMEVRPKKGKIGHAALYPILLQGRLRAALVSGLLAPTNAQGAGAAQS